VEILGYRNIACKDGRQLIKLLGKIVILIMSIIFWGQEFNQEEVFAVENYVGLNEQLNQLLQNEEQLKGAIAGISIRCGDSGQLIYDHFGDIRLRPASNLKLLTAATALKILGENYTFSTEILTDGKLKKGILKGNLYLKGKGDPTLLKTDFEQMAEKLRKLGIRKITGDVVGDDTWFDQTHYPLDLPWSDETTYYGAPISALTASPTKDYDAGSVVIEVRPNNRIGAKPIVRIKPKTTAVKIINHAKTVSEGEEKKLKIVRMHDKKTIEVSGTLSVDSKLMKEWISVPDPTSFALDLFQQSLKNNGIKLDGNIQKGHAPENIHPILIHHSIPLSQLLVPFMKLSNNGHAEILIKEMGRLSKGEGSWEKGLSVFKTELADLGVNPKTMVLRDGSGVSHVDLVPANQISLLLYKIQKENWFPSYLQSLPIAGNKEKMIGGTLRKRLRETAVRGKIRAKTGSISTVSSLSGFIDTKSGKRLIFSILLNNLLDEEYGKKFEDKLVSLLVNQ
jgi:serine-type D-Ala-D-Ala carboxypeptidase/endopeptidase (penicillin-binding protein 4)